MVFGKYRKYVIAMKQLMIKIILYPLKVRDVILIHCMENIFIPLAR